jgi:hypothetical protein
MPPLCRGDQGGDPQGAAYRPAGMSTRGLLLVLSRLVAQFHPESRELLEMVTFFGSPALKTTFRSEHSAHAISANTEAGALEFD